MPLKHEHHSTGPRTPEGKSRSRKNALRHGGRSEQMLLEWEQAEDFVVLRRDYEEEFDPQTPIAVRLMDEALKKHWFWIRAQDNLFNVQNECPVDPLDWTEQDHQQVQLFTRYETSADRSFHRALATLERHGRDRGREGNLRAGRQNSAEKKAAAKVEEKEPTEFQQWVEVATEEDGSQSVLMVPTNDQLLAMAEEMGRPDRIHRKVNFAGPMPATGYEWTKPSEQNQLYGGLGIQRMTCDSWLGIKDEEAVRGWVRPTGLPNLPRIERKDRKRRR